MSAYINDKHVRVAAFQWLDEQCRQFGDVLPRDLLVQGFELEGKRVPLMSRQGIFKPKVLQEIPISITTSPSGPYDDRMSPAGFIIYSYRGTDPKHPENVGLRKAMLRGVPLIYFHGLVPGKYMAVWPVFIIEDNPDALEFSVAVDDPRYLANYQRMTYEDHGYTEDVDQGRRAYITSNVRYRLHQRSFREKVLDAYKEQCALCKLRHTELLDAAHIIPDGEPGGDPIVSNGLALCKLHHAAFDNFFLGIRPDYVIEIRRDVLEEEDGPMLVHGLKGLHEKMIFVPKSRRVRPSREKLDFRYQKFVQMRDGNVGKPAGTIINQSI
jgi:putative restriction endonuclease